MIRQEDANDQDDKELREAWIESLLVSAARSSDHSDRIAMAFNQIDSEQPTPGTPETARQRRRFVQWGSFITAAAVILAFFVLPMRPDAQSEVAAVQRSLNVAAESVTRRYLVRVKFRPANAQGDVEIDLYVRGNDRFVLHYPGTQPINSFWIGRHGNESWVLPPFGPVLDGGDALVNRWLEANGQLDTPHLHVATVLSRMISRGYQLESFDDEEITIEDGSVIVCKHLRAMKKEGSPPEGPTAIDLWASRDTGMAIRLFAQWNVEQTDFGRDSVEILFVSEESNLTDAWFTPAAHLTGRRPFQHRDSFEK